MATTCSCTRRLAPSVRSPYLQPSFISSRRAFSTSTVDNAEASKVKGPAPIDSTTLDPETVITRGQENALRSQRGILPVGSRRRRAIMKQQPDQIAFEQSPYQCFQEARKVLAADREEKLAEIAVMRTRIARAKEIPAEKLGGEYVKKGKVVRMEKYLEQLKVYADLNDPMVKKRFEDGYGDMNRPIYRYLADQKWRSYNRLLINQRISQYHIIPDLLNHIDPIYDCSMHYGRRNIPPGDYIPSRVTQSPPSLRIQPFDRGDRLVSIIVLDPDIPDPENDAFSSNLHFLACNVRLSPTETSVPLASLDADTQVVQPWQPPFAQKGSPYHRLVILVLRQADDKVPLDVAALKEHHRQRRGWKLQRFRDPTRATPVAFNIFRTVWDEDSDEIAKKFDIPGAGIELVRNRVEKLPYKKKDGSRYR